MHARVYDDDDVTACERIITRDILQLETHTARRATPRTLNRALCDFGSAAGRRCHGVAWNLEGQICMPRDRERTGAPAGAKNGTKS